jgi:nitroreductase
VSAYEAALNRRSQSKVTDAAPTELELTRLVQAAASVADHSGLRPWRLIALRGAARERLGAAFVATSGLEGKDAAKLAEKPLRAPLLIAVVCSPRPSFKVPYWEQEAVASGVAHLLSLLLDEAGWGVIWRTGGHTRAPQVAIMHELAENERLLGWLYVGAVPPRDRGTKPRKFYPGEVLTELR